MTHTLDSHERERFAEHVVRHVAAGTGFTTLVTIGLSADGVPVLTRHAFSASRLDASYADLLDSAARMERKYPRGAPAYACALVLPERDVAYLHYANANGAAQVLTVGREPVNDPDTHTEVTAGLTDLMHAIQENPTTGPTDWPGLPRPARIPPADRAGAAAHRAAARLPGPPPPLTPSPEKGQRHDHTRPSTIDSRRRYSSGCPPVVLPRRCGRSRNSPGPGLCQRPPPPGPPGPVRVPCRSVR